MKRTDPVSPVTSARMRRTRSGDNANEKRFRSGLHRLGYRFRIHFRAIPGSRRSIDIAFPKLRLAIFVDGCFWHGCPEHRSSPTNNGAWWSNKIALNRARDQDTDLCLKALGWQVLRIWEHESYDTGMVRILEALEDAKRQG